MMNGADLQLFVHEKMPHVWPLYDFPKIKSMTETWKEIRLFIQSIADGDTIIKKAERVHWDGSREDIKQEDYIIMSNEEVRR
jgi:hypothetical protein